MNAIVQADGGLVKWIPEIPTNCDIEVRLQIIEVRRVIVDRACAWEETAALEKIHAATIAQLDEQLSACEHVKPWQAAKWRGQRDKEVAPSRKCALMMRQYELEVTAWHDKLMMRSGNG